MKCLTLHRHWAWAIIHGAKRVENRAWTTSHRGRLAIHAGLRTDPESRAILEGIGLSIPRDVIGGVLLGTVELVDVVSLEQGILQYGLADDPLATGPSCWILRNPRPLAQPIPMRGRLGLFEIHDTLTGMSTEYLTTVEAAAELRLSEIRVRQLCQDGRLGRKIGRNWAITRSQLEKFRELDRPSHRPAGS